MEAPRSCCRAPIASAACLPPARNSLLQRSAASAPGRDARLFLLAAAPVSAGTGGGRRPIGSRRGGAARRGARRWARGARGRRGPVRGEWGEVCVWGVPRGPARGGGTGLAGPGRTCFPPRRLSRLTPGQGALAPRWCLARPRRPGQPLRPGACRAPVFCRAFAHRSVLQKNHPQNTRTVVLLLWLLAL